jgi:hypothetical protein
MSLAVNLHSQESRPAVTEHVELSSISMLDAVGSWSRGRDGSAAFSLLMLRASLRECIATSLISPNIEGAG